MDEKIVARHDIIPLNYKEKDIKWVKFEEMMGGT
jgi:hypothetical protein